MTDEELYQDAMENIPQDSLDRMDKALSQIDKTHSNMTDALGNPLVVGDRYGYCKQSSGFTTVVTGILSKVTDKYATLAVSTRQRSLWGAKLEDYPYETYPKATVRTRCLFLITQLSG